MLDAFFISTICGRIAQLAREVLQDFRYTLRLWAGRPWHAGLAITALAIGIGAVIAVSRAGPPGAAASIHSTTR
jgi:hypothetical protein